MVLRKIITRLLPIAGLSWLGWLYLNPSISLIPKASQSPEVSVQSIAQPKQTTLSPKPSPEAAAQSTKTPAQSSSSTEKSSPSFDPTVEPNRLEIHLGRRRVIYFVRDIEMESYPIAIGRQGWETPKGKFRVMQMRENPKWINPLTDESIAAGDPKNPLGAYWIGFWTNGRNWIGFHGTPNPETVGQAVSHGCIRMLNEDIENLFYQVSPGTQVIVKQ